MFEIGSSLRDARVRQGLELPELEADTKIRAKYLKALEDERFDLLPGDAYVKGFLRTYAERLGLDGQLYVDEYNSRFSLSDEPVYAARPRRRSRRNRLESHAVLIALAGIVAVTVLVIAAWQIGSSGAPQPEQPGLSISIEPLPEEAAPALTTTAEQPAEVSLIVTAARGASVVEARRGSAGGELLFEGTLARGESQTFEARRIWLRIEKSQNVELELNGDAVRLSGSGAAVLVATASGVRPGDGS